MIAKILTAQAYGYTGKIIEVEADAKAGLPSLQIVGMGNKAIDEARDRVRSAITNSFLEVPPKKMTINLAPAELPKDGTAFDLPIALAILIVSGQLKQKEIGNSLFAGELSLGGELRPIRGIINIVEAAKRQGITTVYVPKDNVNQAILIKGVEVIGVDLLKNLYLHLKRELQLLPSPPRQPLTLPEFNSSPLIDEVSGQEQAKRALTIAAAAGTISYSTALLVQARRCSLRCWQTYSLPYQKRSKSQSLNSIALVVKRLMKLLINALSEHPITPVV